MIINRVVGEEQIIQGQKMKGDRGVGQARLKQCFDGGEAKNEMGRSKNAGGL
jgi:hypothetical protein